LAMGTPIQLVHQSQCATGPSRAPPFRPLILAVS
jgi:hypothetical protein